MASPNGAAGTRRRRLQPGACSEAALSKRNGALWRPRPAKAGAYMSLLMSVNVFPLGKAYCAHKTLVEMQEFKYPLTLLQYTQNEPRRSTRLIRLENRWLIPNNNRRFQMQAFQVAKNHLSRHFFKTVGIVAIVCIAAFVNSSAQ